MRNFGPINLTTISESTDPDTGETRQTQRRPNLAPFADDPDSWLVASIEDYDLETGKAKQGPVFSERVLHPPVTPIIESAADALAVTLHEAGYVDLSRIAELIGRSRDEAIAELGDRIFLDPQLTIENIENWQTADAYLSGPVRTKLAAAIAAAALDPRYQRNIEALRQVQPEDLKPSDISARLGAPWIPAEDVALFSMRSSGSRPSSITRPKSPPGQSTSEPSPARPPPPPNGAPSAATPASFSATRSTQQSRRSTTSLSRMARKSAS